MTLTCTSDGRWSASNIDTLTLAEGTITLEVAQIDVAGNEGEASANILKDKVGPPVGISPPSSINGSNEGSYSLSGTCESGSGSVGVTLGSLATTTLTCSSGGQWSVDSIDTSTLGEGSIALEVTQTDVAGNEGEASADILKDTVAPSVGISTPSPISGANVDMYSLSGTCESGIDVDISLNDLYFATALCGTSGNWEVNNLVITTLNDGMITLEVAQTDNAGNQTEVSHQILKDTVAPDIQIVSFPNINASNVSSYFISGTCESGINVHIALGNLTSMTAACDFNGQWNMANIDMTAIEEGEVYLEVRQTDNIGNEGKDDVEILKDTDVPEVMITSSPPINGANVNMYPISGTCEDGLDVDISLQGLYFVTVTCGADALWSVSNLEATNLEEGTISVEASQRDSAGNEGLSIVGVVKDTIAPQVEVDSSSLLPIDSSNESSYPVSGTCESAEDEDGGEVFIAVGDFILSSGIPCGDDGTWQVNLDFSTFLELILTMEVTQEDSVGNRGSSSVEVEDNRPPFPPTSLDIVTSYGQVTLTASNVKTGDTVQVFDRSDCSSNVLGEAVATENTENSVDVEFTLATYGEHDFYVKVIRDDEESDCSSIFASYDRDRSLVFTWRTHSEDEKITFQLDSSHNYNFVVDWGDGSPSLTAIYGNNVSIFVATVGKNISHVYSDPGDYIVTISGTLPEWPIESDYQREKLISVQDLGDVGWSDLKEAFERCNALISVAGGNTSRLRNLNFLFHLSRSVLPEVSTWDVGNVRYMGSTFANASLANPDVSNWNTSNVEDMSFMFYSATSANPDVSNWNTLNVISIRAIFANVSFTNPDVSNWNTSNVTDMSFAFYNATLANPEVDNWVTSSVTNMASLFSGASSADPEVGNWDTSEVSSMSYMFSGASSANPDVSNWITSNVTDMRSMFANAVSANPDMSNWDFSSVTRMDGMFSGVTLPTATYSALLNQIYATSSQDGVTLDGGNSQYDDSAVDARNALIDRGWTITDNGLE